MVSYRANYMFYQFFFTKLFRFSAFDCRSWICLNSFWYPICEKHSKISNTFFVLGFGKNIASGQPELLSTETSRYIFLMFPFWNCRAKSRENSSFSSVASGNFSNLLRDFKHFKFLPANWHFWQVRALSPISLWMQCHQMFAASLTWSLFPHGQNELPVRRFLSCLLV